MRIRPQSEGNASEKTREIFQEIKTIFGTQHVPTIFQYIAVSESYLVFIWERIKRTIETEQFIGRHEKIILFSERAISKIYQPSAQMNTFTQSTLGNSKKELLVSVRELTQVNATLLLISFALRESIKGIPLEQLTIEEKRGFSSQVQSQDSDRNDTHTSVEKIETMIVPYLHSSSLQALPYPQFFTIVEKEIDSLITKEKYLATRVALEQIAQLSIQALPYPMNSSFKELSDMIPDTELLYELLYILKHRFPPSLPHQLLTSLLMESILKEQKEVSLY